MPRLPLPLTITLGLLAAGALGLVSVLVRFWGILPEYSDRFLILVGAGWVAWLRREEMAVLPIRPFHSGWLLVIVGAAMYPIGWFLQAQVAPKAVVLWWLALSWLSCAAGLTLAFGGTSHLRKLAFPMLFMLFALPIPNRLLIPLQANLQSITTTIAAAVLPNIGIPTQREGFVLTLPGGPLEVAEACSGVRSVTVLTALAAFVAYLKDFGPARGFSLLALSVPVIAAANALRVILSGVIQESVGAEYIQGAWHEALGFLMVFVGLALVLGLAELIDTKKADAVEPPASEATPPVEVLSPTPALTVGVAGWVAVAILVLGVCGTVTAEFLGRSTAQTVAASAPLEQLPRTIENWKSRDVPILKEVTDLLTYDNVVCREYCNDFGDRVNVWVIFWSSQKMVKGYHHPDICLVNRGFGVRERDRTLLTVPHGGDISVTIREFANQQNVIDRRLVLYWTQEGRRVWTDQDEESARLTGDSHSWLAERLFGSAEDREDSRIVVLIDTPFAGDGKRVRKETLDFAAHLADEIYQLCPWARPRTATQNASE